MLQSLAEHSETIVTRTAVQVDMNCDSNCVRRTALDPFKILCYSIK